MSDMASLRELCAKMKGLQEIKDNLEDQLKEVNRNLDDLRLKEIPELMAELEVTTTTFDGLGRVQLASDVYASTVEGQKEAAFRWLRDCGYEDMIVETYNMSTLKAVFRRMIKDGAEIPTNIFKVTPFVRASIVKA